ncbi:class I SAM-dependent methyltransferase [Streptomyces sp. NPDC003717]|uniref:O-methyltransferase n=1 Tax=Streptomyces sp. NPDC003717 TaxID=3154276 RepID=UPI0033ACFC72
MDPELTALLGEVHRHGRAHDAAEPNRLDRLRNLEPDSAALLALVVRAGRARRALELGTSNGYSTLWLADALRDTGGHLVSVDTDPGRSAQAARNLDRAALHADVELRVQDAAETLRQSPDAHWDFVLLDAERPAYPGYWPDLVRTLAPSGLLAVDNVLSHADQVAGFRALVEADPRVVQTVVTVGAGLLLVLRGAPTGAGSGGRAGGA